MLTEFDLGWGCWTDADDLRAVPNLQNQLCAERFGVNLAPGFICLWPCCSLELLDLQLPGNACLP